MSATICPCCGYDLTADEPIRRGPLYMRPYCDCVWYGEPVRLQPTESAILYALAKADGAVLPRRVLAERIGYDGDNTRDYIGVILAQIRRKLEAFGPVRIESIPGKGVRLVLTAPVAPQRLVFAITQGGTPWGLGHSLQLGA